MSLQRAPVHERRRGDPPPPLGARFLPDEVPEAILREVFELAQWAPSNCNVQPWTPHVVSGETLRELRAALVEAGMRDEPIKPGFRRGPQIHRRLSRAAGRRSAATLWRDGRRAARPRRAQNGLYPQSRLSSTRRMRCSSSCTRVRRARGDRYRHVCANADAGADCARNCFLRAGRAGPVSRHRARTYRRACQARSCCSASRSATRMLRVKANVARVGRAEFR